MKRSMPRHISHIIGIDEVGRGPLAGPVTIGMVSIPLRFDRNIFKNVTDSKLMREVKREEWYTTACTYQKYGKLDFKVAHVSNKVIDAKGISYAIHKAIVRVLKDVHPETTFIYLDGSLHAPLQFMHQKTVIKGDQKIPVIAGASVVAKVSRDRLMKRLAKKYASYGFERHKGYGTKAHRELIKTHGICQIHRKTFCKNILDI